MAVFFIKYNKVSGVSSDSDIADVINLEFADNFISYIIEEEDEMSFNIFGVVKDDTDIKLQNVISLVEFNNPNINVVDFEVDTGIVHDGYRLVNIMVTTELLTNNIEQANKLIIQFNDEETKNYDMGLITVQNNKLFNDKHLEPSGEYTVGYPKRSLDINVKNKTDDFVTYSKIYDLTESLSYKFNTNPKIEPQGTTHIKFENFLTVNNFDPDFITITPIISYVLDGEKYNYNLPGVIYGIMDSDIDKIERMIK